MKPNFALNLSLEGISLLRRLPRGWELVGETDLHPPALKRRLAKLREAALEGSTERLTTKLILPESQVLYTSIASPGRDDLARREAIAKALDGMTPYPVDDLAFDFESDGEMLHVAVVARETMEEAESFALEHAFNPVSIVAHPKGGSFTGEPFFGETAAAAGLLPKGTRVQRDVLPTQVTLKLTAPVVPGASKVAEVEQADTAAAVPDEVETASKGEHQPKREDAAAEGVTEVASSEVADKSADTANSDADPKASAATIMVSAPDSATEDEAERALERALSEPLDEEATEAPSEAEDDDAGAAQDEPAAAVPDAAETKPSTAVAEGAPVSEAPAPESTPDAPSEQDAPAATTAPEKPQLEVTASARDTSVSDPSTTAVARTDPVGAELISASLERDDPDEAETGGASSASEPADIAQEAEVAELAASEDERDAASELAGDDSAPQRHGQGRDQAPAPEAQPTPADSAPRLGPAQGRFGVTSGELPPLAPLASVAKPDLPVKPHKAKAPPFASAPEPLRKVLARPHPIPATDPHEAGADGLASSTNVFGARRSGRRRASPLTFVVLTAGLVAFIGAVALWSALFGTSGAPEPAESPAVATLPAPGASVAPAEIAAPAAPAAPDETAAPAESIAPDETAAPDELAAPAAPETNGTDQTALAPPPETEALPSATTEPPPAPAEPVAAAEPLEPEPTPSTSQASPELSEDDIAVAYAATGIWSLAPDTPAPAREERLTAPLRGAVDARVPAQPDPALQTTGTEQIDEAPSEPEAPPPPGVSYRLDARGLVEPLPEGAPSPSGTIVYLGRPALVPPGRGGTSAAVSEPAGASSDALAAAVEGALADLPFALPGTPDTPPRPRPEGLAAVPAPQTAPDPVPTPDPALEPDPAPDTGEAPNDAALPAAEAPNPLAEFRPRPRPGVEPAPEPSSDVASGPAQADTSDGAGSETSGSSPSSDPALAGFRPQPRPFAESAVASETALASADPADETAPAVTRAPPSGDPALAGFRPRPRLGATPGGDSLDDITGAANVIDATAAAAPKSFPDATELAVSVTPIPQSRPSGFAERAAAAQAAAAVAAATQAAASAVVRTPEPTIEAEAEADGEQVEVTPVAVAPSGGPRLPTRASVAEQATVENAIRLNQVNLIGIYGSSSDRRALIRLPSGRYVKVEVGDRVDGGRVAAISDRELRLVKNGRNVVLRIAQGG